MDASWIVRDIWFAEIVPRVDPFALRMLRWTCKEFGAEVARRLRTDFAAVGTSLIAAAFASLRPAMIDWLRTAQQLDSLVAWRHLFPNAAHAGMTRLVADLTRVEDLAFALDRLGLLAEMTACDHFLHSLCPVEVALLNGDNDLLLSVPGMATLLRRQLLDPRAGQALLRQVVTQSPAFLQEFLWLLPPPAHLLDETVASRALRKNAHSLPMLLAALRGDAERTLRQWIDAWVRHGHWRLVGRLCRGMIRTKQWTVAAMRQQVRVACAGQRLPEIITSADWWTSRRASGSATTRATPSRPQSGHA